MRIASPELRLSAQRALVGQVSPNLYGACVDLRDKLIAFIAVEGRGQPLRTEGTWVLLQRGFVTVEG